MQQFEPIMDLNKVGPMEAPADMVLKAGERPVIVTYRCADCGAERVERV